MRLVGLHERVAAAGGVVDAGPNVPKGWRLQRRARPGAWRRAGVTVRLLIADDQELIASALAALLGSKRISRSWPPSGRGDEVVAAAKAKRPDVALLDIEMPGIDGLAAAAVLAEQVPECRALILTTFGRPGYLRRAMESGAYGFVVKDAPPEQLADAIRRVAAR